MRKNHCVARLVNTCVRSARYGGWGERGVRARANVNVHPSTHVVTYVYYVWPIILEPFGDEHRRSNTRRHKKNASQGVNWMLHYVYVLRAFFLLDLVSIHYSCIKWKCHVYLFRYIFVGVLYYSWWNWIHQDLCYSATACWCWYYIICHSCGTLVLKYARFLRTFVVEISVNYLSTCALVICMCVGMWRDTAHFCPPQAQCRRARECTCVHADARAITE